MSPLVMLGVRSLHVLAAIALVGGIFARQIVRREAGRSADVRSFAALTIAARRIENLLVIPGSLAAVVIGVVLGLITDAPILGYFQGAERNWLLVANVLILSLILLPAWVFVPHRRRIEDALKTALESDRITADLKAVWSEPAPRFWHHVEEVAVLVVVLLMALRPF